MNRRSQPLPIIVGLVLVFVIFLIAVFIYFLNSGSGPSVEIVGNETIRDITIKYSNNPYKTNSQNEEAAREYLRDSGVVSSEYLDNAEITRRIDDNSDDLGMSEHEVKLPMKHYFFQQKIEGIPVNGALLGVHVRNNNEIYYASGKTLENTQVENETMSLESAVRVAVEDARGELGQNVLLNDPMAEKVIYNGRLIGVSNNSRNIPAAKVVVSTQEGEKPFSKEYFVSLTNGKILEEIPLIYEALNRQIYNCNNTISNCSLVRSEGDSAVGDNEVDGLYNYLGDTYNFFSSNYQRDSYDNRGSSLRGYAYVYPSNGPNASWNSLTRKLSFTPGMAVNDIAGHELTHAVTSSTAGLKYRAQSGAINEGMSDVFGWAVDQNDWNMGEDSVLGSIRSMSNPPAHGQPDSVFAPNYHCSATDRYGVHRNSGVVNKAFYLMVEGGSFNTCNISSIGQDRAFAIYYRSLTRYLSTNSNFRDLYNSLIQSCNDLYDQSVCDQVDVALQAVEMDQQPANSQFSPVCSGGSGQPPNCSGNSQQSPVPTSATTPGQTSPTQGQVRYQISGRVFEDSNGNSTYDTGEGMPNASVSLSGDLTDTTTTLANGVYVFDNLFAGAFNVSYQNESRNGLQLTQSQPQVNLDFIVTRDQTNPTPTIVVGPTSIPASPTQGPTSVPRVPTSSVTSTPSPTPATYYNCSPDPECIQNRDSIQLCPLICTEQE